MTLTPFRPFCPSATNDAPADLNTVDLAASLDAESRRAVEEGLSEEEYALFCLLLQKERISSVFPEGSARPGFGGRALHGPDFSGTFRTACRAGGSSRRSRAQCRR